MRDNSLAGLVLTGGASTRLGQDKAVLPIDGERLVDRTVRLLSDVCAPVIEVGPGYSSLPFISEQPPSSGPLVALAAGIDVLRQQGFTGGAIVLAVDLPRLAPALLDWLVAYPGDHSVVPIVDDRAQTLCARYNASALDAVSALVKNGERSLQSLLNVISVNRASIDEWGEVVTPECFFDIDTPEDLDRSGYSGEQIFSE